MSSTVNGNGLTNSNNKSNVALENGHLSSAYSDLLSSSETLLITVGDPEPSPPKFPKEPKKLFFSWLFLMFSAAVNDIVLAWIHDRVPDTSPLPDLFFSLFPYWSGALAVSEYLILISLVTMFTICLVHKYRWILIRRVFSIAALLYTLRGLCMLVTQVPVADPSYYCSPKLNTTNVRVVLIRTLQLLSGGGLQINGKHTFCGDYIYSGHTLILVMTYLVVKEYSPRRYWHLHWLVWLLSATGVFCILISRGHYTIDVILAYYITTRVFWLYHTLANNPSLQENTVVTNLLTREFWFAYFRYMECNVVAVVPRQFEWPLPWPRCFVRTIATKTSSNHHNNYNQSGYNYKLLRNE